MLHRAMRAKASTVEVAASAALSKARDLHPLKLIFMVQACEKEQNWAWTMEKMLDEKNWKKLKEARTKADKTTKGLLMNKAKEWKCSKEMDTDRTYAAITAIPRFSCHPVLYVSMMLNEELRNNRERWADYQVAILCVCSVSWIAMFVSTLYTESTFLISSWLMLVI